MQPTNSIEKVLLPTQSRFAYQYTRVREHVSSVDTERNDKKIYSARHHAICFPFPLAFQYCDTLLLVGEDPSAGYSSTLPSSGDRSTVYSNDVQGLELETPVTLPSRLSLIALDKSSSSTKAFV